MFAGPRWRKPGLYLNSGKWNTTSSPLHCELWPNGICHEKVDPSGLACWWEYDFQVILQIWTMPLFNFLLKRKKQKQKSKCDRQRKPFCSLIWNRQWHLLLRWGESLSLWEEGNPPGQQNESSLCLLRGLHLKSRSSAAWVGWAPLQKDSPLWIYLGSIWWKVLS